MRHSHGQCLEMGSGWDTRCGQLAGILRTGPPTPCCPLQPGKAAPRVREGLQGFYLSHDKQAQHRAGRRCHRGRASPSCDLGAGTGTAERTGADAAGAEAKPGTPTAYSLSPSPQAWLNQLLPLGDAAFTKPLPSLVPVPILVGNTQHRYLQSKTELTNITNN